jgi:hypothetical protein
MYHLEFIRQGGHMSAPRDENGKQIAANINEPQRAEHRKWTEQLLELKTSEIATTGKTKKAITLTVNSQFISTAAKLIANTATPNDLRDLTDKLIEIINSKLSLRAKFAQAIKTIAKGLKSTAWDNRALTARLALSGAIAGAVFFGGLGGQGAGIAEPCSAIGVLLWVVFGAGAGFIGILYEDITGKKNKYQNHIHSNKCWKLRYPHRQ